MQIKLDQDLQSRFMALTMGDSEDKLQRPAVPNADRDKSMLFEHERLSTRSMIRNPREEVRLMVNDDGWFLYCCWKEGRKTLSICPSSKPTATVLSEWSPGMKVTLVISRRSSVKENENEPSYKTPGAPSLISDGESVTVYT